MMSRRKSKSSHPSALPAATGIAAAEEVQRLPSSPDALRERALTAELQQMIATAAYFRAERRGFAAGAELEDWLQAESEAMAWLSSSPGE